MPLPCSRILLEVVVSSTTFTTSLWARTRFSKPALRHELPSTPNLYISLHKVKMTASLYSVAVVISEEERWISQRGDMSRSFILTSLCLRVRITTTTSRICEFRLRWIKPALKSLPILLTMKVTSTTDCSVSTSTQEPLPR